MTRVEAKQEQSTRHWQQGDARHHLHPFSDSDTLVEVRQSRVHQGGTFGIAKQALP